MTTKQGRMVAHLDGLLLMKSHDPLMAMTFGSILTYLKRLLTVKSHNALIMWSYKVTWQTKIIVSLLPECLRPPNLAGWLVTLMGCYLLSHMTLWSHISTMTLFLATELGRMVTYLEGFLTIKSHNALVIWSYKVTWKTKIILKKIAYGYKLGRMITYLDEFLPVKLHSSLITWSCKIMWQTKTVISLLPVSMATKLARMVIYLDRLLIIKSYKTLIMWYCKVPWQTKTIIFVLEECLWQSNLAEWWLPLMGFYL